MPPYAARYVPGQPFVCGQRAVPWAQVNDGYCDCADGSDEPGTSACAFRFVCANAGARAATLPSSRVGDGVCDCCDGSDETHGPRPCPNTCAEEGRRLQQAAAARRAMLERALAARAEGLAAHAAPAMRAEKEAQRTGLQADVERLRADEDAQNTALTAAEEALRTLKASLRERLEAEYGVTADAEDGASAEAAAPEADEWGDSEGGDDAGRPEEAPGDSAGADAAPAETPRERVDREVDADAGVVAAQAEVDRVREALNTARSQRRTQEDALRDVEAFLALDFGPDGEFAPLYGQSVSLESGEYVYSIEFFKGAKQGATSLGTWAGWADGAMRHDGGLRCWGGPDRSLTVALQCGAHTELVDVREPSKCTYAATVRTEYACRPEMLHALQ